MTVEKFCLNCLHEIIYDTTEHHYCCECFAARTIPDEEDMPSLEHIPAHWIETDTIPKMTEEIERLKDRHAKCNAALRVVEVELDQAYRVLAECDRRFEFYGVDKKSQIRVHIADILKPPAPLP